MKGKGIGRAAEGRGNMRDREKGHVEQLGDKRRQLGGVRSLSGHGRWVSSERVGIALLRMHVRIDVCVCTCEYPCTPVVVHVCKSVFFLECGG